MWNGFNVIDTDAHMLEPIDLWDKYVEPEYHDVCPKVIAMEGHTFVYEHDPKFFPASERRQIPDHYNKAMADKYGEAYDKWWSPEIRLRDMDIHGWDIQVCLSTNANRIPEVAFKDAGLGEALARAYHNWCHEYCSANTRRLKFTSTLAAVNSEEMVTEARRTVEELGAVSVRNPYLPQGKWLHEPEYDTLWALACELDFPISIHGESRARDFAPFRSLHKVEGPFNALDHIIGFPFDNMVRLAQFIFTGLLERYPTLRLGVLESNVGWAPFWLARMDGHTEGRRLILGSRLAQKPSEYVMRQVTISADCDEPTLKSVISDMGDEAIVWNTDYPHSDAPDPDTVLPVFMDQPISDQNKRKILWDNAIRLYGPRLLEA